MVKFKDRLIFTLETMVYTSRFGLDRRKT